MANGCHSSHKLCQFIILNVLPFKIYGFDVLTAIPPWVISALSLRVCLDGEI